MTTEWEDVKAILTQEQKELIKSHAYLRGKRRRKGVQCHQTNGENASTKPTIFQSLLN